jgi:hypothetical protein
VDLGAVGAVPSVRSGADREQTRADRQERGRGRGDSYSQECGADRQEGTLSLASHVGLLRFDE